jgi:hypothetical protein
MEEQNYELRLTEQDTDYKMCGDAMLEIES